MHIKIRGKGPELTDKSNRTEQNRTEQNRTEQNRTEQNRTEQNRTEQNRTEQVDSLVHPSTHKQRLSELFRTDVFS